MSGALNESVGAAEPRPVANTTTAATAASREADGKGAPAAGEPPRLPLAQRLSDRLNAILVRETQQAMNGRAFLGALVLALGAILLVGLLVAYGGESSRQAGWKGFVLAMQVLFPILGFIVPMQAFLSMRHEAAAGTVEHLLLSRLSPGSVVRGKVAAAFVESLLFFSIFAPLIAMTYLLRGVDVPTIAYTLAVTLAYAVGATTFAIAMGSLSRHAAFRALPLIVASLGLAVGTIAVIGEMPDILRGFVRALRTERESGAILTVFLLPVVIATPILYLVASAALAHPYENRSTAFRATAMLGFLALVGWLLWATDDAREALPYLVAMCAPLSAPFWVFAVTEEERLSPRVKTLVPKSRVLAALATPFLPGGGRGYLWVMLFSGLSCVTLVWARSTVSYTASAIVAFVAWGYVLIYASLGRLLRMALPPGSRGTMFARLGVPLLVALLAIAPTLTDLLVYGHGRPSGTLHILNPFETVHDIAQGGHTNSVYMVLLIALGAAVGQIPAVARGVFEAMSASAARRRRRAA